MTSSKIRIGEKGLTELHNNSFLYEKVKKNSLQQAQIKNPKQKCNIQQRNENVKEKNTIHKELMVL